MILELGAAGEQSPGDGGTPDGAIRHPAEAVLYLPAGMVYASDARRQGAFHGCHWQVPVELRFFIPGNSPVPVLRPSNTSAVLSFPWETVQFYQ